MWGSGGQWLVISVEMKSFVLDIFLVKFASLVSIDLWLITILVGISPVVAGIFLLLAIWLFISSEKVVDLVLSGFVVMRASLSLIHI